MSGPYYNQGYPQYDGSLAQPYQSYNTPPPGGAYNRAPQQQQPYPASSQQGYARPPPPPPQGQGQPYGSSQSPYPGQPPQSPYPTQQSPYPGQQPPQSQYPGQQQPYGQAPYPNQGAPYPGGQGRPGPSPGPPGGQYGAPGGPPPQAAPATPQQLNAYRQLLISTIQEKSLESFYPPERLNQLVQTLANDAPGKLAKLTNEWSVPMEVATDVMKLALFDVILYVDDSGSIEFEEKGLRKDQLRQILGIVATAASTFDQDGISVRFMNNQERGDGIRSAMDVENLVSRVRFAGLTPLGTGLKDKVVDPMVVGPARANRLDKPVLIITITDGQPAGEPHGALRDVIQHAVNEVSRTRYGRGAVSFQFTQVGNDQRAREFLSELDEDPQIGQLIDCTSNFEVEQDEMSRAVPPVHLTRELWCAKIMLGAIDSSYDTKDEKAAGRSNAPPPQQGGYGGYGQAPPQGPPGGYNAPSGYPPQPSYQQAPQQPPQPPYQQGNSQGNPAYGQGQGQAPYGYGAPSPQPGGSGYPPYGSHGQAPPRRY
ncbi:uncharacterized protein N7477_009441 [Penicillium maclennaniae]|uniref:uncharacterized protein n=1 Tax=Penicillium maclennaniae TaxID=1343394 RepID=UPI002540CCC2|nr:uncharacterized protein N7477_009441 [Penicillium maclennaniae]KAJ5661825.1 hypothetical protein N7477_009441 [Penicillium maclennaniae]